MFDIRTKLKLSDFEISNTSSFVLIGGINVIETQDIVFSVASHLKNVCDKLQIPLIFKASYDKANRSSFHSYRGPGINKGLEILKEVKQTFNIPILTDVHSPEEAYLAAKICDVIQLPAFLGRQTDLISAMASTNAIINIKKPQFMSPYQMVNLVKKFIESGNNKLIICERGSVFGYDNLIVDMLGFGVIKKICNDIPIIFDVTHSLQCRDKEATESGGRRAQLFELAKAATSLGLSGLFLETHPDPDTAKCDGPSALPLKDVELVLKQLKDLDTLIKSFQKINII